MTEPLHFGDVRLPETFWQNVQPEYNSGCWLWLGASDNKTYGTFAKRRAHRMTLEAAMGEDLGERWSLHRCDNPPCVNPAHLFPGTVGDNVRDMWSKGRQAGLVAENVLKTHCLNGHPLSGNNLRISPQGWRLCKECARTWNRNFRPSRAKIPTPPSEEAVRQPEIISRPYSRLTHCPHGHEFTPQNTLIRKGWRECRTCDAIPRGRKRKHFRSGSSTP